MTAPEWIAVIVAGSPVAICAAIVAVWLVGWAAMAVDIVTAAVRPGRRVHLGFVTKIVDGDTIHIGGRSHRLSGVDAPDRHTRRGRAATNRIRWVAPVGSIVWAVQRDTDRHGRAVSRVWRLGVPIVAVLFVPPPRAVVWRYGRGRTRSPLRRWWWRVLVGKPG